MKETLIHIDIEKICIIPKIQNGYRICAELQNKTGKVRRRYIAFKTGDDFAEIKSLFNSL